MRATMLTYDIPTGLRDADNDRVANPSGELRRLGTRVNLSVWIVPDGRVAEAQAVMGPYASAGARVEYVRFDKSEAATILRLAREGLRAEVERVQDALDAN